MEEIRRNTEEYTSELEKTIKMLKFNNDTEIRILHKENTQLRKTQDELIEYCEVRKNALETKATHKDDEYWNGKLMGAIHELKEIKSMLVGGQE